MCLEKADKKNIKDDVSGVRKAKSLVGRWWERSPIAGEHDMAHKLPGDTLIERERETVVLADVAVGRGRSSAKVSKQYPVIDIHDKYYDKWCMAKAHKKIMRRTPTTTNSRFAWQEVHKGSAEVQRCRFGRGQTIDTSGRTYQIARR